ncbi:MAG: DUF4177 domain-containing protein [Propionibacteriaceae bacterium]|nr:DUF4177 domain-containing protein [Propionibacteriaceae bacterium]
MKQYVVQPAGTGVIGKGVTAQSAAQTFSDMINYYAQQGWNYHSMETVSVTTTGCAAFFTNLIGGSNTTIYYILIFEHDVS